MTNFDLENAMKVAAFHALNTRYRVLGAFSEARVIYPEFNPCRAEHPIAIVEWPAIVAMQPVTLTHAIYDGDRVPISK